MLKGHSENMDRFWPTIMRAWYEFAEKKPIIECDVVAGTVAAMPAQQYLDNISKQAEEREKIRKNYEEITWEGGMLVFIKDTANEKMTYQAIIP